VDRNPILPVHRAQDRAPERLRSHGARRPSGLPAPGRAGPRSRHRARL